MYYVPQDAQSSVCNEWAAIHCSRWNVRTSVGYLAVVFTSYGNRNKGIDTRVTKANAVLRELCCSVVKTGAFKDRKAFRLVFVSILVCGHDPQVTTRRILSQEQAAEMGFVRRVHGVTLRDKMHRFEIRKARNVTPLFRFERSQLRGPAMFPESARKDLRGKSCWLHWWDISREVQGPGGVTTSSTLCGPRGLCETAVNREVFRVHVELLPPRDPPPQRKSGQENEWMNEYVHWNFLFIKLSFFLSKVNVVFK